jgi:hypothetical protein
MAFSGLSILKDCLHLVRTETAAKHAYVRMEPGPGSLLKRGA